MYKPLQRISKKDIYFKCIFIYICMKRYSIEFNIFTSVSFDSRLNWISSAASAFKWGYIYILKKCKIDPMKYLLDVAVILLPADAVGKVWPAVPVPLLVCPAVPPVWFCVDNSPIVPPVPCRTVSVDCSPLGDFSEDIFVLSILKERNFEMLTKEFYNTSPSTSLKYIYRREQRNCEYCNHAFDQQLFH